jgi:hypothetical protein
MTEENLDLLLDFKIPGIIVKNFIDKETCFEVANRLNALKFGNYDHLKDIPVQQVGLCHNQWATEDKSVYFSKKQQANQIVESIYQGLGIDPVQMVIDLLSSRGGKAAGVFEEPGYGEYFSGAFRRFNGHGKLHVDHAPSHISHPWIVTQILRQMTWNIYYTMPSTGGELVIYDTVHTAENDKMKVPQDYYFPYQVLERDDCIKITPRVGDFIMFNTQNFHEIFGQADESRISQTSFMGLKADGSLGLWS